MNYRILRVLSILLICVFSNQAFAEYIYKPFSKSMRKKYHNTREYKRYEKIYESRNPLKLKRSEEVLIPKVIHQIWLGPKRIPEKYIEYSRTWRKLHPGWEYKLWSEKDVESWDFPNKDLFNKASSYQEKADILRYEILLKHGGLYVDFDMKPLKKFDDLHYYYTFYAGLEGPWVTNAIIGSVPNNVIFKDALKDIRMHWNNFDDSKYADEIVNLAVDRCMSPFGSSIYNHIGYMDRAIVFPETYLTLGYKNRGFNKLIHFLHLDWLFKRFKTHRYIQDETMSFQLVGEKKIVSKP